MTIHFVGAGPGAADLLTLRAVELLGAADVCVYAGTYLDGSVLGHCRYDARRVDTQDLDLDQITDVLVAAHRDGLDVVRLCSGDPSIYSALHEQTRRLDAAGVPWDVTPGVPAMPDGESLTEFARSGATLVLHLAITRTRELAAGLVEHLGADCPVVVVSNASQPSELVLRGTLADIADRVEAAGLRQAAVILVGRALAEDVRGAESYLYAPSRDRSAKG
jgi:precorrin-4/cobalt-precorrin-4 C11-methyltransferase